MSKVDLESKEIEINGLNNIAKQLILKGNYSRALYYLNQVYNEFYLPKVNEIRSLQQYREWKDSPSGQRTEKVRKVISDMTSYESEKNRRESSREDHLEAYSSIVSSVGFPGGAEGVAESISAEYAPTRVELDISKRERLSNLESSIKEYARLEL